MFSSMICKTSWERIPPLVAVTKRKKKTDLCSLICFSAYAKYMENQRMQTNPAANSFIHNNWKTVDHFDMNQTQPTTLESKLSHSEM